MFIRPATFRPWLVTLLLVAAASLPALAAFSRQSRVGFRVGDQWEPSVAADGFGHLYVLYPQYGLVPGCRSCPLPSMTLVISNDNGNSWRAPRLITPPGTGQYDPQIVVDPADRRTVYASWVQNGKNDVIVAKSVDFGQSWSITIAARYHDSDKPVLVVRGADVYVAYNQAQTLWVASSHDAGITFSSVPVSSGGLSWALPAAGTIDPDGNVYFAWAAYPLGKQSVNLSISRTTDNGESWTTTEMDHSGAAPTCAAFHCGWSYLGAQITVASDAAGTLYTLWTSSKADREPQRVYFASSTTAGQTWSAKTEVSGTPASVEHAFPTVVAGNTGDVRIAWMDTRNSPRWNTLYRSSTNGGATWSAETRLSGGAVGYRYIRADGFGFPFGDYFGIAIDNRGDSHVVWGEGLNFDSPGSVWHSSGR